MYCATVVVFMEIIATQEGNTVHMLPREREPNLDKIVFSSLASAAKYCGVPTSELRHLINTVISQSRVVYKVGGPIARSATGIAAPGIVLYPSWPGYTRLVTSTDGPVKQKKPQQHCPVNKDSENVPNKLQQRVILQMEMTVTVILKLRVPLMW